LPVTRPVDHFRYADFAGLIHRVALGYLT